MTEGGDGSRCVVVADDEADIVELLAILLRRAGYDVLAARNGPEALKLIRERLPAACILDAIMPGMLGFEVLQELRSSPETSRIPVIILTATVDEEREIRRHGVQPEVFMKKPFENDELLAEVARLVG